MLSSQSILNQTVKQVSPDQVIPQASADTIEPASKDSPPVDTMDSIKTVNSDSPSSKHLFFDQDIVTNIGTLSPMSPKINVSVNYLSVITIQSNLTTETKLTNKDKHASKLQKLKKLLTK